MGAANGTAVGQEQVAGHGPAAGGGIGSSGSGVTGVGSVGTCGTNGCSVTVVTRAGNGSGGIGNGGGSWGSAGSVSGAQGTGNGVRAAGKSWARGTGCRLDCGSGGIGSVDTGDGDGADGADKASSGTRGIGMQTKGKGSGRATELAGVIGRAQGRGGQCSGVDEGQTAGTAGSSNLLGATGRGCMTGAAGGIGSVGGAENESRASRASGASRTAAGEGTGDSSIGIVAGGCNVACRGLAAWITSYLGYKSWIAAWNSIQQAGSARASRAAAKVLHDASSV